MTKTELIFKNEYTITKPLVYEYIFQAALKKLIISGLLISLIGFVLHIILASPVLLTAALICFLTVMIAPFLTVSELMESSKRLNNGTIKKTEITFSSNIVMQEGNVHLEFEYSQIKKIVMTKHLIVLMIGKQNAILVYRDGFTVGTEDTFDKFIKERCNHAAV